MWRIGQSGKLRSLLAHGPLDQLHHAQGIMFQAREHGQADDIFQRLSNILLFGRFSARQGYCVSQASQAILDQ